MTRRVLYGVLNWGLGHATRSSVLIHALQDEGFEVILASDGAAGDWLQEEFPHLEYRPLPEYDIQYSSSNRQWPTLLAQLPKMAKAAKLEHALLKVWVEELEPCGIISDNRLGFYHAKVPSVYLSHQLRPLVGPFSGIAGRMHQFYFRHYDQIWVPDHADLKISGALSRSRKPFEFTGLLSALKTKPDAEASQILIILSGPEPQRSILERKLFEQADALPKDTILVRGINGACPDRYSQRFKVYDRLGREDLSLLLQKADVVISRSGYSSIMDYIHLGKRALLVPTPGQSEQEYLAALHSQRPQFRAARQGNIDLKEELKALRSVEAPEPQEGQLNRELFSLFSA